MKCNVQRGLRASQRFTDGRFEVFFRRCWCGGFDDQPGTGHARHREVGAVELGTLEQRAHHLCPLQIGTLKLGAIHARTLERSAGASGEVDLLQVHLVGEECLIGIQVRCSWELA